MHQWSHTHGPAMGTPSERKVPRADALGHCSPAEVPSGPGVIDILHDVDFVLKVSLKA
jgi:hypothetical protein